MKIEEDTEDFSYYNDQKDIKIINNITKKIKVQQLNYFNIFK